MEIASQAQSAPMDPLCACGCEQPTLWDDHRLRWNKFLNGHNRTGERLTETQRHIISLRQRGRIVSDLTRDKLSKSHMGKGKGRMVTTETRSKMSNAKKGENNPFFGKKTAFWGQHHSKEFKTLQSRRLLDLWKDKDWKESRIRSTMSGCLRKPTRPEKRFIDLCSRQYLPYRYNSINLDLIIGGKIPDFYNVNGKKEVVEIFGRYFHDSARTPYSGTEKGKIEHYASYGFKCVVLWEDEDDEVWLKKVAQP